METLVRDVRHSLRLFRQSPGFMAAAVAALALGIGTNTAIFSVVNSVLLKPAPFPDPDRLVMFLNVSPQGSGPGASPTKFNAWRGESGLFQDVSAFRNGVVNLTGGAFPEQIRSAQVSADFFRLFGARVWLGRIFTAREDMPRGDHVVVLNQGFWARRFGSDPKLIGQTISLGGEPHTVIGVIAAGFDFRDFGPEPDVFVPFQLDPESNDQGHYFQAAGRLRPGVTLAQANARLKITADQFWRKWFGRRVPDQSFGVEPMRESLVKNVRQSLVVLAGAVSFVLLIACANVANLLLARAVGRRREIAIRAAIGAGRSRIVRQLLTESLLLAFTGAAAGAVLGIAGIRALLAVNTANLPRVGVEGALVNVDWRVLAFTAAVAVVTGLLFGLFPALQVSRADLSATLKESGSRSGSGLRQNKARTLLVVSEISLAVVLVVGAALLIRTSMALAAVNPGFDARNVLTLRMSLAGARFVKSAAVERLTEDGLQRVRALPGVVSASAACCVPLEGGYGLPFLIMGRPLPNNNPFHGGGGWQTISTGYFDVFRIPVVRGRAFTERDTGGSTPVVVINQTMARKYWIGKGLMPQLAQEQPREIVGVVGDIHDGALNRDPQSLMYVPAGQVPDALNELNVNLTPQAWMVRTQGNPASLSAAIQEQLRKLSGLPVSDVRTMDEVISRSISRQRFNMLMMTIFGASALLLAAIEIYRLMAYAVEQRTQEIGIRIALGAGAGDVRRMVVWQGMRYSLAGVVVGFAAALALTRVISTFLFGVQARDPLVFTAVPLLLAAVALAAVWIPARRATRIDPVIALRYE